MHMSLHTCSDPKHILYIKDDNVGNSEIMTSLIQNDDVYFYCQHESN